MLKKLKLLLAQMLSKQYDKAIPTPVLIHSGVGISPPSIVINTTPLEECLINHEGLKHYAYTDTEGLITIGCGRNLSITGTGLSTDEIIFLLRNDITRCRKQLHGLQWYQDCDPVRQDVLTELCFNTGFNGLMSFKNLIECVKERNWIKAADELENSHWAKQVGENRCTNMANRLRTGTY